MYAAVRAHKMALLFVNTRSQAELIFQELWRINTEGHTRVAVACPACNHEFTVEMAGDRLGGS